MYRRAGGNRGLLSVLAYHGEIKQSSEVVVRGKDRRGETIRIKATHLTVEALGRKIDHLNGMLYIDHVESPDRLHKAEYPLTSERGTIEPRR